MAGFVPRKRRVTTTADTAHRFPDLLEGDFGASAPDVAWVGISATSEPAKGSSTWRSSWTWRPVAWSVCINGATPQSITRDRRVAGSDRNPRRPSAGCGVPHRPRQPIHVWVYRSAVSGLRHPPISRTDRGVLGQRRRIVVPRHPKERTRQPGRLPQPRPGPPVNPLVDRSLVQPPSASLHHRATATKRMGGQLLSSHSRINRVSNSRGELQPRSLLL